MGLSIRSNTTATGRMFPCILRLFIFLAYHHAPRTVFTPYLYYFCLGDINKNEHHMNV
jgi:hypothetical protein